MSPKPSCNAHLADVIHDFHPESTTPYGSVVVTPAYGATCVHCTALQRWLVDTYTG